MSYGDAAGGLGGLLQQAEGTLPVRLDHRPAHRGERPRPPIRVADLARCVLRPFPPACVGEGGGDGDDRLGLAVRGHALGDRLTPAALPEAHQEPGQLDRQVLVAALQAVAVDREPSQGRQIRRRPLLERELLRGGKLRDRVAVAQRGRE
jgi:hypothetical protein